MADSKQKIYNEQRDEISRLKAENKEQKQTITALKKKPEPTAIANALRDISYESKLNPAEKTSLRAIAKEIDHLTNELKAKDEALELYGDHMKK